MSGSATINMQPRGLSRVEAARYIGIGPTLFDEMVKDGRMPPPRRANSRAIWDRAELDVFFEALPRMFGARFKGVGPTCGQPRVPQNSGVSRKWRAAP